MGFKVWTFRDKRDSVVKVVQDTPFKNTSLTLEETKHLTSNQKFWKKPTWSQFILGSLKGFNAHKLSLISSFLTSLSSLSFFH